VAQILTDAEEAALAEGSKFHQQSIATELFKLKVRRDARRMLEAEEIQAQGGSFESVARLVYEPLPEASPELIPGILPESGTAAIVGETDTGKSLIALEMASSLLTGQPLWGEIVPNRTIERVVYVLGEHTCVTLQGLFHRTQLPHQGDFKLIGPEHLHPYKAIVIAGVAQPIAIDRLVRWTEGANLIVFDPLAGFVQGLNSEQDNSAMRTLIDSMSYVADKNKSACMILSHMGKPRIDDQGGEIRRTSYAMRGASAQEDALTHVFYLRRQTLVKQQGAQERFELSVRKFKGSPSNESCVLERDPVTKRNTLINGLAAAKNKVGRDGVSREERAAFYAQVNNLRSEKPDFKYETCLEIVAASHKIPMATVKRWEDAGF
jgi:RecA-family ATPase